MVYKYFSITISMSENLFYQRDIDLERRNSMHKAKCKKKLYVIDLIRSLPRFNWLITRFSLHRFQVRPFNMAFHKDYVVLVQVFVTELHHHCQSFIKSFIIDPIKFITREEWYFVTHW